ncbi:MAG: hypothetical protein ACI8W7_000890 [Gammaproteobacteria bacterium]|jgi:hypothetical protein
MHRQTNDTYLIHDCAFNGPANPPRRVGLRIEIDAPDQIYPLRESTQDVLFDKDQQRKCAIHVALGYFNDPTKAALNQPSTA